MIIVAGEALIDRIVRADGRTEELPGGGPYNAARTIARLGGRVAFLGGLSTDTRGRRLRTALLDDGVDLRWAVETSSPTTLAVAAIDALGVADYQFELSGTSAAAPSEASTHALAQADAVLVGGLGLVAEPIATGLAHGVATLDTAVLLMVDPNCRPSAIERRDAYLARLQGILGRADVVKVSRDDLAYLDPGRSAIEAARRLVGTRPALVVLTDGDRAVRMLGGGFDLEVPVPSVEVVDTVGAGDAFGGALLLWLMEQGGRGTLGDEALVRGAVERAVGVAALTCQRAGAAPPTRAEAGWPPSPGDRG